MFKNCIDLFHKSITLFETVSKFGVMPGKCSMVAREGGGKNL
jgi:hypothetical protein